MSNNRNYSIVFLLITLIIIGTIVLFADRKTDRSFQQYVVSIDTTKIQQINIIKPKNDTLVNLIKNDNQWSVKVESGLMAANEKKVSELIFQISEIEIIRQISNSENVWAQYGVTDSTAIQIVVKSKKTQLANFYCGNTDFDTQTQQICCYVRKLGDNRTYKVNGYLSLALSGNFDAWIKKY